MPLDLTLSDVVTVDEVRVQIGRPSKDPLDPGYVADADIEAVVQRVHDEALAAVYAEIETKIARGLPPGPNRLNGFENVDLEVSTTLPGLLEGTIDASLYPWVHYAENSYGRQLHYDEEVLRTYNTAFVPVYAYKVIGDRIYVTPPGTPGTFAPDPGEDLFVLVHAPALQELLDHVAGGGILQSCNDRILQTCARTLAGAVQTGTRLERVFEPGDGLPKDKS